MSQLRSGHRVLVLGAVSEVSGVVLLEPTFAVENGAPIG